MVPPDMRDIANLVAGPGTRCRVFGHAVVRSVRTATIRARGSVGSGTASLRGHESKPYPFLALSLVEVVPHPRDLRGQLRHETLLEDAQPSRCRCDGRAQALEPLLGWSGVDEELGQLLVPRCGLCRRRADERRRGRSGLDG